MATVAPSAIRELLDQVDALKKLIETAGIEGRTRLDEIPVAAVRKDVIGPTGKLDDDTWNKQSEDDQIKLRHRLVQVRDSLRVAAGVDGPTDPQHIMYGEYASSFSVITSTVVAFLLVVALLCGIVYKWDVATGTDVGKEVTAAKTALAALDAADVSRSKAIDALIAARTAEDTAKATSARRQAEQEVEAAQRTSTSAAVAAIQAIRGERGVDERTILLMVTLLGALGGSLHLVGSLVKYIGNRQLKRSWLLYYLSLPLAGAALAPIVYMLLRVGILTPSGAAGGRSVTADLNLIGIYAFAAMTGMFAKIATDKLSEVFSTIFRPPPERGTRDALASERPGGS